ncbi:hypothetical protein MFIFM68171_09850 [Madurella fahalii]|uniref:Uncharacterized protein n=1 Tax=Madurella fahalii TaxID=1157608 RepID=A0ABQ0GPH2_9PEZI
MLRHLRHWLRRRRQHRVSPDSLPSYKSIEKIPIPDRIDTSVYDNDLLDAVAKVTRVRRVANALDEGAARIACAIGMCAASAPATRAAAVATISANSIAKLALAYVDDAITQANPPRASAIHRGPAAVAAKARALHSAAPGLGYQAVLTGISAAAEAMEDIVIAAPAVTNRPAVILACAKRIVNVAYAVGSGIAAAGDTYKKSPETAFALGAATTAVAIFTGRTCYIDLDA